MAKYEDGGFVGTVPYFSVSTHEKKTQSYRDDLESLGYAILNMLVGDHNLWFELQSPYAKDFIDSKLEFINSTTENPKLKHMRSYLKTVRSLGFEDKPDYASLSKELYKINEPIFEAKTNLSPQLAN